jgi:hypothetical protein
MNRTTILGLLCLLFPASNPPCQEAAATPAPDAQDPVIKGLVDRMREAEQKAMRVSLELSTEGRMPGDLEFRTRGTLRVLRAEQPAEVAAVHSVLEYSFAEGLSGRMEAVKTRDGVVMLEQNPTFGELFLQIDAALVADLEWAGRVLQRTDLPGLGDARAAAPLGSEMVADLARRYALAPLSNKDRAGQDGTWVGGDRRPGLEADGDGMGQATADRVEMFVRNQDHALLEVVFLQAGKVVQRIKVDKLVVGEPMPIESFQIDPRGRKPKPIKEHAPAWEQIQQILQRAKAKAQDGDLPPSERGK